MLDLSDTQNALTHIDMYEASLKYAPSFKRAGGIPEGIRISYDDY